MRVTENTNYDTIRNSIRRSRERMEDLQVQSSTLRKLNTPSDDPVGAAKVLEIRTDKVNNEQFMMNAKLAESYLNNTEAALGELTDIVVRAKEIAINQSSRASSNEDTRIGVAEEISQLYTQAVATANRRVGDRYLFGGFKTQRPPVDPQGRYQGDDGQMMVEVAKDIFLTMNIPGIEAFNSNPKNSSDDRNLKAPTDAKGHPVQDRAPATTVDGESGYKTQEEEGKENVNVFDELQNLRIALLTGNLDGIHQTLERFDEIHGKIVATRAKIGSRMQGLQTTSQAVERHNVVNAQLNSGLEDADMAQVVSDLAKEETVLRSSLSSSHKLIQPTLMDFLK